jgi:hypothetical protein
MITKSFEYQTMTNIITYQIDGNKSINNLFTHHQAYVYEGFLLQQTSNALWSHQFFLHDWWTCTSHHESLGVFHPTPPHLWFFRYHISTIIATLALGSRPRQGLARLRAKRRLGNEGKCEGMNPHTPNGASTLGVWSPGGLPNLQRTIAGVKTQWIKEFFISLENYWNLDV